MRWPALLLWPLLSVAAATAATWALWTYIQPAPSPLFFVAVMTSCLYGGLAAGLIATGASSVAIAFFFMTPRFSFDIGADDAFRLGAFAAVALLTSSIVSARNRAEAAQRQTISDLQGADERIQTLSDLLPMCPHCRRVRSGGATWMAFDRYVEDAPDLRLSHALCPQCATSKYAEFHGPGEQTATS